MVPPSLELHSSAPPSSPSSKVAVFLKHTSGSGWLVVVPEELVVLVVPEVPEVQVVQVVLVVLVPVVLVPERTRLACHVFVFVPSSTVIWPMMH